MVQEVFRFPLPDTPKTRLWLSENAMKGLMRFRKRGDPQGAFWKKLVSCAQAGFPYYELGEQPVLRHEWDGVYRFGVKISLFRLIGFYEDDTKKDFLIFDSFLKTGQKLTAPQRKAIDGVALIRKNRLWRKASDAKGYPRLAE